MKSLRSLGLMLLVCSNAAMAQVEPGSFGYYNEALLFSRTNPGGSARIQGIGGSQIALGGDISSANSNPAGLGFFNKSVFSFTPQFNSLESDTDFRGRNTNTFKNNFNISNMGVVFNSSRNIEGSKFKGGSFSLSFQRVNDFHNEVNYEAYSNDNSIIDSYIETAGTNNPENLSGFESLAYDHFLMDLADYDLPSTEPFYIEENGVIFPNPGDGVFEGYGSPFGRESNPYSLPRQSGSIRTRGAQYQWNLSYGANYDDTFYFGGGIGVQSTSYTRERTYIEDEFAFEDGTIDDLLNDFRVDDRLSITGIGINATLGVIVRPMDFFRFGLTYVTPTYSSFNEESDYLFATSWNPSYSYDVGDDVIGLDEITDESDLLLSNYRFRTPSKLSIGTAFFLGKGGFLTGDVEFVDYASAQVKSNDFSVTADNRTINNLYKSAVNYRLGGEFRYDMFRFRAGYAYQGDPFASDDISNSIKRVSGGIGCRLQDYYVDFAVTKSNSDATFTPYNLLDGTEPLAEIQNSSTSFNVTLGFNF
ncbi:MAG: hypothetical protein JXQ96_06475 [Cyclobacteriaceae bacterium]